jgi:hypothetical protein
LVKLGLELGKKTAQGAGGGESFFQIAALAKVDDVLRGITETDPVGGAVRA